MKQIAVDFLYLDLNTCERCMATDDTLKEALNVLSGVFDTLGYQVKVNSVNITSKELAEEYRFISSPTIRVNSIDICNEVIESECKDCGDLCGGGTVDCRVFVYEGKEYEQPPVAMIMDGILKAIYGQKPYEDTTYTLPDNLDRFFTGKNSCCDNTQSNNNFRSDFSMKTMSIYEPAMCCETGVCGVGVDPELLRISTVLSNLKKKGVEVKRYNLSSFPQEFIKNQEINKLIMGDGVESLPAIVVDGKIVMIKKYPSNEEIASLLEIPVSYCGEYAAKVKITAKKASDGCCCGDEGCC